MATLSMQLHNRFDSIQKHFNLFDHSSATFMNHALESNAQVDALQFESTILDGPPVLTRASLFIYFNAAVSSDLPESNHVANRKAVRAAAHREP